MKDSSPTTGPDQARDVPPATLMALARALAGSDALAAILMDGAGRVVAAGPGAGSPLGLSRPPLPGEPVAGFFPQDQWMALEQLVEDASSLGATRTALLEAGHGEGRRRVLAVSVLPVPDADPDGAALAFLARDITAEHEQAERLRRGTLDVIRFNAELRRESTARQMALQALEELSARLKSVLAAASRVAVVATSPSGIITMFNPGAVNLLGFTVEEMEGRETPLAFLDEDELARRGRELGQAGVGVLAALARRGGQDFGEWTLNRKDGGSFAAELVISAIEGPHGVEGYLLVGVDISGRKKAEEAMAEREARLRAILNGAGEGIVTVDGRGLIETANPAAEAMFGRPEGGLDGLAFEDVAPGALDQAHGPYGGPGREAVGVRADGSTFPMELTVSTVEFASKSLRTCILRDITARRQAEEAQRGYTRRLAEQQAALERDLRAAAEIQKSLLPKGLPEDPRYNALWLFEPSAAIGGDIFNILALGPDVIAAYILDVSGHGVPSALVAAAAAQALQFHSRAGLGPARPRDVLAALDEEFPLERFGRYFSLFYLTLDLGTGKLDYCGAGHPSPVLRRRGGGLARLDAGGTVIGLGGLMPFEEGEALLEPGDVLALYTDGLTEFEGPEGGRFGADNLEQWLAARQAGGLGGMMKSLRRRLKAFGGKAKPQDDLSVLLLELAAPGGRGGGA